MTERGDEVSGSTREHHATRRRPQRPVRIGIYLPTLTGGLAPGGAMPRFAELAALARDLEAAGFDSLWVADELNPVFDDGTRLGYWEAMTILAGLARWTSRVRLGPLVASAGFRNPGLLAKIAVTLDEISEGRFALGIGAGYDESEHRVFGMPWEHRVARLEEYLAIVRGLLDGDRVTVAGQFHSADGARLDPPPRPGAVPLVLGTMAVGPRLIRAVARYADEWCGWLAFDDNRPEALLPQLAAIDAACTEYGRHPLTLARSVGVSVALGDAPLRWGPVDCTTIAIRGDAEEIAARLASFASIGVGEVVLYTFPIGPAEVDRLAAVVAALDRLGPPAIQRLAPAR